MSPLRPLLSRPYLLASIALGVALYFAAMPWIAREVTRALIGWDAGVIAFLVLTFVFMSGGDAQVMKRRAVAHDEGGDLILVLTILASIASVGALVAELLDAKGRPNGGCQVALAAGTVVLSWLFVQIVFAIHYAHVYYLEEEEGSPKGGLAFGECGEPDYWDFVHFAIVLGATSQTADITFTSKRTRRIGTLHTLVAFGFNTAILATMINLAAGFF
ncbi:MAG TPA: DUF1345 domain-containing protein [Rhizomicrobium sp.]|nr:DUF1345 domain-containing protein [Rhizomicrobium sp.]